MQGGGYQFFAGTDGSKAYVTGDFSQEGLTTKIDDLDDASLAGIVEFRQFYANHGRKGACSRAAFTTSTHQ